MWHRWRFVVAEEGPRDRRLICLRRPRSRRETGHTIAVLEVPDSRVELAFATVGLRVLAKRVAAVRCAYTPSNGGEAGLCRGRNGVSGGHILQAWTSMNISWLPKVRSQMKHGKAGWGEASATILLVVVPNGLAERGDGLGGGGNGGPAEAGPAANRCPLSPPGVIGSSAVASASSTLLFLVAMGRSLSPSGVMGSSGTAKVLQLTPVAKLPPLWNFLLTCKGPGWRASPTRHARIP